MPTNIRPSLNTLLLRLNNAHEEFRLTSLDYSWRGGGDPADVPRIEAAYELAKTELVIAKRELRTRIKELPNGS